MIINTIYGKVKGINEGSTILFKGIPYAKPPMGRLRFRRPEKLEPWEGIFSAEKFGYRAIQQDNVDGEVQPQISEDCLTLNIATPGIEGNCRPVVVWIHGGGAITGSGSDSLEKAISFVKDGDIVYVSINYRLGVLGFLHLGDLLGEEYETSANCAILDMVKALKWVKENITFFGGDSNNVTIMGESAGAKSVAALLVTSDAKGLFHKAILESGSIQCIRDKYTAQQNTEKFLKELGLVKDEAIKLLDMPVEKLLEAQSKLVAGTGGLHFYGPVIDGITIVKPPMEIIYEDKANKVSVLIGTNKDEMNLFLMFDNDLENKDKTVISNMFGKNSDVLWEAYKEYCIYKSEDKAWKELLTDYVYRISATRLANGLADMGWPVWMYRLDFQTSKGTFHAMDLDFVWDAINSPNNMMKNLEATYSETDAKVLAKKIHESWMAFIKSGNPAVQGLPRWDTYSIEKKEVMILDKNCKIKQLTSLRENLNFPDQVLIYK